MEWEVTAFPSGDNLALWMESEQQVSVSGSTEMDFIVWPTRQDSDDLFDQWKLKLSLRDDKEVVVESTYTYGTLFEATRDAEALLGYLQHTTDAPGKRPRSIPTQIPIVQTRQWTGE